MKVAVFSTKSYDREFLSRRNDGAHQLEFFDVRLSAETVPLAHGADAVCAFVNDDLGGGVIGQLAAAGVRLIALRSAGFNHVDLRIVRIRGHYVRRETVGAS